jgi:hypothetical protein
MATSLIGIAVGLGALLAAAEAALVAVTWLPGERNLLPEAVAWPFVLLVVPLVVGAASCVMGRSVRERARTGVPAPRFGRPAWTTLPPEFISMREWIGIVLGFAALFGLTSLGSPNAARHLLTFAFGFTMIATMLSAAERRGRRSRHLRGVLGWPQPPVPPRGLARSRLLISWLLAVGLGLTASGAAALVLRLNAYTDGAAQLSSSGVRTVQLPGGDDVIFVGLLGERAPRPFGPLQVNVVDLRTGMPVPTRFDPSSDHLSPRDVPSLGLISFVAPAAGSYRISIDGPKGLFVVVVRNEGAEARLLAGWIAMLAVGVVLMVMGVVGLLRWLYWRYRVVAGPGSQPPSTIEEWMARTPY